MKESRKVSGFEGKHFVKEDTHAGHSAVECFKCSNCGNMFPTEGLDTKKCPVCGHIDTRQESQIVMCSIEEF